MARILLVRAQAASEAPDWSGDDATRAEIRTQLDWARASAEGTPHAEEVASLTHDLDALDQRAAALRAERAAAAAAERSAGLFAILDRIAPEGRVASPGAHGAMMGDQIGDAFGFGGLGLRGSGVGERGGGGTAEGIGLGSLGTIGHGAGGGSGSGHGSGAGGLGRARGPSATVTVTATATGSLDAAAVEAVARRQAGSLRLCYEQGLRVDPSLSGTMEIRGVVTPTGTVESARASGFGDGTVTGCMSRAIARAAFPPSSGSTTITVRATCTPSP
jgi:hypothetical protein